jgi:multisubunit Na+/H+ antiporter MnhB subunit
VSDLVQLLARLLFLPILVLAAALLVTGYTDVGDGFSAGLLAALAVLLQYVAFGRRAVRRALPVGLAPAVAFAGLGLAVAIAFAPALWGESPVTHYPAPESGVTRLGTFELLTGVALDVGIFVFVLGLGVAAIELVAGARREDRE